MYNAVMIRSKLPDVKLATERARGHKITYEMISHGASISGSTIARMLSLDPIDRIDGKTLDGLCGYFDCQVGDLLEYVPGNAIESQRPGKKMRGSQEA